MCFQLLCFLVVFAKVFRVKIWHYVSVAHFLHILYSKQLTFLRMLQKDSCKKRPNNDGKKEHDVTLIFFPFFRIKDIAKFVKSIL